MSVVRVINGVVTPRAVRAELARIVVSEGFARSRRMQRFLEYVVEETLAGRADQLGEYAVGVAVFDRGQDFEPAVDPIVRNDARRLRVKLLEYYREMATERQDPVFIEMPKGGYVPVFRAMKAARVNADADRPRRLGVLPFEVLSDAVEHQAYAHALCMSLTAGVTSVDGLEAVAHCYLRSQSPRQAAAKLGLSHLIHGGILMTASRCSAVVNLIHAADGTQLWAQEFNFEADELATAHAGITSTVSREVKARLASTIAHPRLALAA